jgi:5'-3' exonuclease
MNGKKMAWQGVALLPFINEKELLDALGGYENQLTESERNRNTLGEDLLFVNTSHVLAPLLAAAQELPDGMFLHLLNRLSTSTTTYQPLQPLINPLVLILSSS